MLADKEKILLRYNEGDEDSRHGRSRNQSLEFYYTEKHLGHFIKPGSRVIELGCATGYYAMRFADKCAEYFGVDLVPKHIAQFKEKIASSGLKNVGCALGDATDLTFIPDSCFDVVLCLGPMYHLSPSERSKAFTECARVCKPGGIAAFAYINACGVYAGACITAPEVYPNALTNDNVFRIGTDDLRPGLFWYTSPEEIEVEAKSRGLTKIFDLGTDFFIFANCVDSMDDARFELMRPLYDKMIFSESCTGLSNHALLVCRKENEK